MQLKESACRLCAQGMASRCKDDVGTSTQTGMQACCALQHLSRDLSWLTRGSWLVKKVTTSCWNNGSMSPGNCCRSNSRLDMFLKVSSLLSSCSSSSLPMYKSSSSAAMKQIHMLENVPHTAQIHGLHKLCATNRLTNAPCGVCRCCSCMTVHGESES